MATIQYLTTIVSLKLTFDLHETAHCLLNLTPT